MLLKKVKHVYSLILSFKFVKIFHLKKIKVNLILVLVISAMLALLFIQAFQTVQLFDRKTTEFNSKAQVILERIEPDDFILIEYIKKLEELKLKTKEQITWSPDEWDNWCGDY